MTPFESGVRFVGSESVVPAAEGLTFSPEKIARLLIEWDESTYCPDELTESYEDLDQGHEMEVDWRSGFDTIAVCAVSCGIEGKIKVEAGTLLALDMSYFLPEEGRTLYRVRTEHDGVSFAFYAHETGSDDEYPQILAEGLCAYENASEEELALSVKRIGEVGTLQAQALRSAEKVW